MTDFLRQGSHVYYTLPNAREVGLAERQAGIILSGNHHNNLQKNRPIVCPVYLAPTVAPHLDNIFVLSSGKKVYFRPDLACSVGREFTQAPHKFEGSAYYPHSITKALIRAFQDIISPSLEKMQIRGVGGFLEYGEYGWFNDLTSPDGFINKKAPAVCLTTPDISKVTRTALVLRGYTHLERFRPPSDVAVTPRYFQPAFCETTDITLVSIELCSRSKQDARTRLNDRALRGIAKKTFGHLNHAAHKEILQKYPMIVGALPDHIRQAISKNHAGFGSGYHKPLAFGS